MGLRIWYPVDQVTEEIVNPVKAKKKKKAKKVVEKLDDFDDIEELEVEEFDDLEDFATKMMMIYWMMKMTMMMMT